MRKLIFLSFSVFCFSNALAQIPENVPQNGLIAYYPFSGNVNDVSGNGFNASLNGAVSDTDRFGQLQSAYAFDGIDDYIFAGRFNNRNFYNTEYSFSLWFYTQDSSLTPMILLGLDSACYGSQGQLRMLLREPVSCFSGDRDNLTYEGTGFGSTCSRPMPSTGIWNHVVVTKGPTEGKLYINGSLISTLNHTGTSQPSSPKAYGVHFGARWARPQNCISSINGRGNFFKGKMDDIGIWDRALDSCEVEALYQSPYNFSVSPHTSMICSGDSVSFNLSGLDTSFNYSIVDTTTLLALGNVLSNADSGQINIGPITRSAAFKVEVYNPNTGCSWLHDTVLQVNVISSPSCSVNIDILINKNGLWKYDDSGANLTNTNWKLLTYNDNLWASGNGILGFGNGNESTVVSFGSSASNKHRTTYFRKTINLNNASSYDSIQFNVLRDDGVVVYLNGTEVLRDNMPTGSINYFTFANASQGGTQETTYYPFKASANLLQNGPNIIAVEVHQASQISSDLSFDMEFIGYKSCLGPSLGDTSIASACNFYVWPINGQLYDSSGVYTDTIATPEGCDSLVTLDLQINPNTRDSLTVSACDGFTLNGLTYTSTGLYQQQLFNQNGCDSIIVLDLTILQSNTDTLQVQTCDSYQLNGISYTSSGIYQQVLVNSAGCDSILILDLSLSQSDFVEDSIFSCEPYTWLDGNTYFTSNNRAQVILNNSDSCDSIIQLNLTIPQINNVVFQVGDSLRSTSLSGNFQWLYCDSNFASIPGATGPSYKPLVDGSYAVLVSDQNCLDTSDCFIVSGLDSENYPSSDFELFPNPAHDFINVNLPDGVQIEQIEVYSLQGKLVHRITPIHQGGTYRFDVNQFAKGGYLICFNDQYRRIVMIE